MNRAWIIPLPPGSEAPAARGETKQAVGLYPCINAGHCDQFILVKLDNKGHPYGTCSPHEVNIKGCKMRKVKGAPEDVQEQTYGAYQAALEQVQALTDIPDSYTRYLDNAWASHKPDETPKEIDDENISAQDGA